LEQLLNEVAELRGKSEQYRDEISRLLGILSGVLEPRGSCFGKIFNNLTLTLELLSYYYSKWSRSSGNVSAQERDRIRRENGERCVMILRWLFIASLSSIEYSAKESVASYPKDSPVKNLVKVRKGQRVYLSDIMRKSKRSSLMDDDAYEDWQNLIFLRNCIVHNNGFSDENRSINMGGTTIAASVGKMIQGKLDDFAILTEVAIDRYFTWVKVLIQEYGS